MDYYPYEVCPQYSDRYRHTSYVDEDGRWMVFLVGAENDPALIFAFTMSVIACSSWWMHCFRFSYHTGCQKVPRKPSRSLDSSICYDWDQCVLRLLWLLHPTSVQVTAH
jgi:hypothetical protein